MTRPVRILCLVALLLAPATFTAASRRPPARPTGTKRTPAPSSHVQPNDPSPAAASLAPLATVPANVPRAALDARLRGSVEVRARVTEFGTVDSVVATGGDPRLRPAAQDAVRGYVYPPQLRATWVTATVPIDGSVEFEPLDVDVIAIAQESERTGDTRTAIEAWGGALRRVGRHPSLRDTWAIRRHVVELGLRLPPMPMPEGSIGVSAISARVEQQRTVARAAHEDLVATFEEVIQAAAWWDEIYQWEAASLLGCGRSADAIRDIVLFRMATRDSTSRARADRALAGIARGDSLLVGEMLKLEGRQVEKEE